MFSVLRHQHSQMKPSSKHCEYFQILRKTVTVTSSISENILQLCNAYNLQMLNCMKLTCRTFNSFAIFNCRRNGNLPVNKDFPHFTNSIQHIAASKYVVF